jgi:soluble lytic murein transglycosylase-like protein
MNTQIPNINIKPKTVEVIEKYSSIAELKNEQFKIEYSNNKFVKQTKVTPVDYSYYIPQIPLSKELQEYTYDLCRTNNVDYKLLLSIMWEESRFEANKIHINSNHSIDRGLCQVNSCHIPDLKKQGITNLLDPYQNIKAGIIVLKPLLLSYGQKSGLVAYGLGIKGMKHAKRKGIYITKAVQNVLKMKDEYDKL